MEKLKLEELINYALFKGASYCDFYFEETETKNTNLIDEKIDSVDIKIISGVGIRLIYNETEYYAYTNDQTFESIKSKINELSINFKNSNKLKIKLNDLKVYGGNDISVEDSDIITFLKKNDSFTRNLGNLIEQVSHSLFESFKEVIIVNSLGKYVKEYRYLSRYYIKIFVFKDSLKTSSSYNIAKGTKANDILKLDFEKEIQECYDIALRKLNPIDLKGGKMPVIIGSGFGGVIIHEAFGHPVEANHIAFHESVLEGKLGDKIASDIVNIIDDGSLKDVWGSTLIDDDGNETKKNILIENGILKTYLVDNYNGQKLNMKTTSSSRRENYKYSTTTRMNNTYLQPGQDKISDMIKSIKYGLYAKSFTGGSVDPITGDFNFTVDEGYLIIDGEITGLVKTASLIGNALNTLCNIDMISDDFAYGYGICGARSGNVPVTASQPTIRVSEILVGGTI